MYLPGPGQRFLTLKSAVKPWAQLLQKQPEEFYRLPWLLETLPGEGSRRWWWMGGGERTLLLLTAAFNSSKNNNTPPLRCDRTVAGRSAAAAAVRTQACCWSALLFAWEKKKTGGYSVTWMVSCSKSCSTGPLFWPLWCAAAELWSWEMRAVFLVCGREGEREERRKKIRWDR